MSLHHDPVVDRAMRANISNGLHFFDPDTLRFFRSRFSMGAEGYDGFLYLLEHRRPVMMGNVQVQVTHCRVVRVDPNSGEAETLDHEGNPSTLDPASCTFTKQEYKRPAQARKALYRFASREPSKAGGAS